MSSVATEQRHGHPQDAMNPNMPRPPNPGTAERSFLDLDEHTDQKTPTRDSFGSQVIQPHPQQQPPHMGEYQPNDMNTLDRSNSLRSNHSTDSHDISMEDVGDSQDLSDNDSVTSDSNRPSKKKKGQRFFCTEFPPCQLSFTRSEHLARHIRKHTGERPFQCHCLRRFSRLDNLRQHAQTVHVNEEIPGDSLAATGTRFQRQIRTDRMRPPGGRARSSTLGTPGPHSRGHSRNYSGSSIGSTTSEFGSPDDRRRRPPPLAMAQTTPTRGSLSIDTYNANGPEAYRAYYNYSPSGYSTPTSMFSTDAASPVIPQGLQSPISMVPRTHSWAGRTHARRLSVPSGQSPYQSLTGYVSYPTPYMNPIAASSQSTFSNGSSIVTSPTSTGFSDFQRDQEFISDAKRKRQTWHPTTYTSTGRPATSGLSYYQTPDAPEPVASTQPPATQSVRLPGIDSFDRAQARSAAPPRRPPSAMEVDEPMRQGMTHPRESGEYVTSPRDSWSSMHQNMNRLDITNATPREISSRDGYANATQPMPQPTNTRQENLYQIPRKAVPPSVDTTQNQPPITPPQQEQPVTPHKQRRQAWYNGPLSSSTDSQSSNAMHRTSPEGSSSSDGIPTPSTTQEIHPLILQDHEREPIHEAIPIEAAGREFHHKPHELNRKEPASEQAQQAHNSPNHQNAPSSPHSGADTNRLDALVAVATSEDRAMHGQ